MHIRAAQLRAVHLEDPRRVVLLGEHVAARVHDGVCPNVYEFWWTRNGARKYGPGRAVALALPAPIASATDRST